MKRKKIKLLCLGILATMVVSSTPVFASTITDNTAKVPENSVSLNGQATVKGTKITSNREVKFKVNTYSNAPADVKAKYEANCKATNTKPSLSDEILTPTSINNIQGTNITANSIASSTVTGIYYDSSNGQITAKLEYNSDGYISYVYYRANTSDYIGYGHITSGDQVKCLQATLDYLRGYNLDVDGQFGSLTQQAVLDFQSKKNLSCDGIVGPLTWKAILGV